MTISCQPNPGPFGNDSRCAIFFGAVGYGTTKLNYVTMLRPPHDFRHPHMFEEAAIIYFFLAVIIMHIPYASLLWQNLNVFPFYDAIL